MEMLEQTNEDEGEKKEEKFEWKEKNDGIWTICPFFVFFSLFERAPCSYY